MIHDVHRAVAVRLVASWWRSISSTILLLTCASVLLGLPGVVRSNDDNGDQKAMLTLIQIGDIHGHLLPRSNLREDGRGAVMEGGLARIATKIKQIRRADAEALLFNTGDTIQGGAEALYTSGQAMVDVLDAFGIDGFAPGNWEYLYGKARFLELFGSGTGTGGVGHRWGAVAANLYDADTGVRPLPPYIVKSVKGIKIGIMGLTTDRGLPAIPFANDGWTFTGDAAELPGLIDTLRNDEKVDVVVLLSEFGLAQNTLLADKFPGIDVIFSADMHETTPKLVVTHNGTMVSEAGQDGTRMAVLSLQLVNKQIVGHDYEFIRVDSSIPPDAATKSKIQNIRKAFVRGRDFMTHVNPISGGTLKTPIDKVVGHTAVGLHRTNFSDHSLPAVIEGTSHDFLTDAFREQGGSDFASIRGFRYGTHVPRGPIRLEDLYHYLPTGAQIARGTIPGQQLKNILENTINGSLNMDPFAWSGGWLFGFSGIQLDLDLSVPHGQRAKNVMVRRQASGMLEPLDVSEKYTVSGFWFAGEPNRVGAFQNAGDIHVLTGDGGEILDGTEVVANHLRTHVADPMTGRIRLLQLLPPPVFANKEIQPLRGAAAN